MSHCNPASTVSINLSNVAGAPFDRLLAAGLKLKAKKCHLFCKKVVYLGHVISEAGIATDPEKTKSVDSWPVPTNVKELRSFIYQSIFEFFKCCLTFICPFNFSPFLCEFVQTFR
jgi:hypothetical protein